MFKNVYGIRHDYLHTFFYFVFEFKPNFTDKYFIKSIINQVKDNFVLNRDRTIHV
jgi:hypothetical protein